MWGVGPSVGHCRSAQMSLKDIPFRHAGHSGAECLIEICIIEQTLKEFQNEV